MLEWLRRRGQTTGAIERFWRVVLVSALDEELDRTDARYGVDVFWKAFLMNSTGYRMGVPVVPLADLYAGLQSRHRNARRGSASAGPGASLESRRHQNQVACNSMAAGKSQRTPMFSPCRTTRSSS